MLSLSLDFLREPGVGLAINSFFVSPVPRVLFGVEKTFYLFFS